MRIIHLTYQPIEGPRWQVQGKYEGHTSDGLTGAKNTSLLHGPRKSSEECKLPKIYSEKYAEQRPHKEKEARSVSKNKCGKSIDFDRETKETNTMESHDDHTPKKKIRLKSI